MYTAGGLMTAATASKVEEIQPAVDRAFVSDRAESEVLVFGWIRLEM